MRQAAKLYNVSRTTLTNQRARIALQRDWKPKLIKLTKTKELVIVQHILDLDSQGFPP